jgi:hypothetical protein
MRWLWQRREPPPRIPPYQPPITQEYAPVRHEPGIVVEEIDTSAMTQTGVHKAWKRLTGQ